jgi:CMD domain protein
MDELAGLAPDSPLALLRRQRPDVVRHLQGSDDAIFEPGDDGGLTVAERAAVALRIAVLLRHTRLQEHYRTRLAASGSDPRLLSAANDGAAGITDARLRLVFAHAERLTVDPDSARRAHIEELLAAGLSPRGLLALSQLTAYVNFQSRVLAGLIMLGGAQ